MPTAETALTVRDVVSIDLHAASEGMPSGLTVAQAAGNQNGAVQSGVEAATVASVLSGEGSVMPTASGSTLSNKPLAGPAVIGNILSRLRSKLGADRYDRYFAMPAAMKLGQSGLQIVVGSTMLAQLYDQHFRSAVVEAAMEETGWPTVDVRFVVDPTAPAYAPGAPGSRPGINAAATAGSTSQVHDAAGTEIAPGTRRAAPTSPQRPSRVPVAPMRLADLVVGEFNRLAYDAATRAAHAKLDGVSGVLLVIGPCGQGKTALLSAAAHEAELGKRASVRFVTAETFMNEFLAALRAGSPTAIDSFRKGYRQLDLLCVDDVHVLGNKTATQAELQHTIDAITQRGGCVFASAMAHPRRLAGFSQHLASRLVAGLVAEISVPEPISMQRAARALLRRKGLLADEQCVSAIVASLPRTSSSADGVNNGPSLRDIEGQVHKVEAVARLMGSAIARSVGGDNAPLAGGEFRTAGAASVSTSGSIPIGLLVVQRALGSSGPMAGMDPARARSSPSTEHSNSSGNTGVRSAARAIRVDGIIATVCDELRVVHEELASKGRHPRVVLARAVVVLLAKRFTNMSFPEIARAIGRPNHSTVITALQRLTRQIADAQVLDGGERYGAVEIGLLCEQLARRVQERA